MLNIKIEHLEDFIRLEKSVSVHLNFFIPRRTLIIYESEDPAKFPKMNKLERFKVSLCPR